MQSNSSTEQETGRPKKMNQGIGYLPGLDGLRAIAVLAVLLYHADLAWARGGFLGVDIFFVISGYLITSLLLAEKSQTGRIKLTAFWLRRAKRLLPALFLLIAATLAWAVLFLPDEVAGLRGDATAALVYATNWYFIVVQKSYFEAVGRPSLFQQLWSLAVEEQFYLVWPLFLSLTLWLLKPRRILWLVVLGAVASTLLMAVLYQPDADPSRVYYGTDTRAAGLLIGAALAFAWRIWNLPTSRATGEMKQARVIWLERIPSVGLDLVGLVALAGVLWACSQVIEFDPGLYRGGFAIVSIVTAILIGVTVHPRAHLGKLLSLPPLVWIGQRSYGIYLWHWPVFMLTRPRLDVPLEGIPLLLLRFALTFVIAELSYRFVETPIRSGELGRAWHGLNDPNSVQHRSWVISGGAFLGSMVVFTLVLASSVISAKPPPPPDYLASLMTPSSVAGKGATPAGSATLKVAHPATTPTLVVSISATMTVTATEVLTASTGITLPVTALGDSVMLEAAPVLREIMPGIQVDAALGRQTWTTTDLLKARQAAGQLAPIVVIHLGNNGVFSATQFDRMMGVLADAQRVVFVNNKVPRAWQDPNNQVLAQGVRRYSNTVLVDWYGASYDHPEYFWNDGIHTRGEGTRVYANLIARAVNEAPHPTPSSQR